SRLQALVDKKRVVVTEAAIRDALHLDDAKGVDCLPNEEIFTELACMGYEKPTTKLTFYKSFFSSQWKFLIRTILQSMSAKRTSWNEFSSTMAFAVICLSTGRKFNFSKYIFESLVRNVDSSIKFYMYPRVGKGYSGVETPLFEGILVAREPEEQEDAANDQPIPSPTPLTPPPQQPQGTSQRVDTFDDTLMEDVSNQEREFNRAEDAVKETKEVKEYIADTQVEGRRADIYHIDMDHAAKVLKVIAAVSEIVSVAAVIPFDVPETISAADIRTVTAPSVKVVASVKAVVPSSRRKIGVVIRDPGEESSAKTPTETTSKDKGKGMSYDDIRPIFVAKFNANMEFLLKSKEQIEEEESREITTINETPAKRRKLIKEAKKAESIKQHLQIVPDEDDDVFTEATPLTRKVPVVDYQVILVNNKPRYKIIKADDTHQLYASFITMLKIFDREDLEPLWRIVKERFSTSKPNNFSDEYLLTALKMMFERPDGQNNVWNQSIVHGQALVKSWKLLTSCRVHIISFNTTQIILLVKRRYPLMKFTLEQMLNVVRL
nr:glutamic acid-rich protein-like [Tanacetum cinerariifolium]